MYLRGIPKKAKTIYVSSIALCLFTILPIILSSVKCSGFCTTICSKCCSVHFFSELQPEIPCTPLLWRLPSNYTSMIKPKNHYKKQQKCERYCISVPVETKSNRKRFERMLFHSRLKYQQEKLGDMKQQISFPLCLLSVRRDCVGRGNRTPCVQ